MRVLKSLKEAQPGQTLQFVYHSGSRPGTAREARVDEVLADRILGTAIACDEPRQYMFDQASEIVVVKGVGENIVSDCLCATGLNETTRVRRRPISFVDARQRIHDQVDELSGEDLAEVLAEIDGHDRATFDETHGQVIVEDDVCVPHCRLNMECNPTIAGIDWVNEEGDAVTTISTNNNGVIELYLDDKQVTAEQIIRGIAQHLGLTIT